MISLLTKEQMEKLPTHRLLAYIKKLRRYTIPSVYYDDYFEGCNCNSCSSARRETRPYVDIFIEAKEILSKREHVERKK